MNYSQSMTEIAELEELYLLGEPLREINDEMKINLTMYFERDRSRRVNRIGKASLFHCFCCGDETRMAVSCRCAFAALGCAMAPERQICTSCIKAHSILNDFFRRLFEAPLACGRGGAKLRYHRWLEQCLDEISGASRKAKVLRDRLEAPMVTRNDSLFFTEKDYERETRACFVATGFLDWRELASAIQKKIDSDLARALVRAGLI